MAVYKQTDNGKGPAYRKVDRRKWDSAPIWEAMKNWPIGSEATEEEDKESEVLEDE